MAKPSRAKVKKTTTKEEPKELRTSDLIEDVKNEILAECKKLANNESFSCHILIERTKDLQVLESKQMNNSQDHEQNNEVRASH